MPAAILSQVKLGQVYSLEVNTATVLQIIVKKIMVSITAALNQAQAVLLASKGCD